MTYYVAEIRFNRKRKRERKMRKRLTKRLTALLFALVLVSTLVMIIPAAVGSNHSGQSDPVESLLQKLSNDISNGTKFPEGAFKNPNAFEGQRNALLNKIKAVENQVEAGADKGAINKLKNDLINSIENWMVDSDARQELIDTIWDIINILQGFPVAIFTESAETVYTGETITFNASDSYDYDGYITSYFWDFGDETDTTGMIATHAYADDGIYTVTLTVTDNDGQTDTATSTKTILNRPPVAIFTESAESVLIGEVIYFSASESYDPDGVIESYFWDFGDGTNATGVTVDHSYADNGTYIVTLTLTDDDGATASANATKYVGNRPPVAFFTESAEIVLTGVVIHFNASESRDPDGYITSYFWDFGDGSNATGVTVDNAYVDDGVYTVTLTVTDNDGATDTTASTKIVLNRPPVASFTENATTVLTGEVIHFNASGSEDPDGSIISYLWDFGDGTNATGVVVDHAYASNGTYTVTLKVTDNDDAVDFASSTKTVLPPPPPNKPPVAVFTESATTVFTNEIIKFDASASYDVDGKIVSYSWDFGDGNGATGVFVEYAYADDGVYNVTLTVTDDDDATDTAISTKYVWNRPPVANFTESAETVFTGEVVAFNATSSHDPDGIIDSYFWDFGDGSNAIGATVVHTYADDGLYMVTLTVIDDDGLMDTATSTKTVLNRPPVASFTENATTVLTGEAIHFDASDSHDPDGHVVWYIWDFGDITGASGESISHAYEDDGFYTVTLTVIDDDGATSSTGAVKTVLNRPPVALFTQNATTVKEDEAIHFDASESYDPDGTIVSYFWDFDDGTNATDMAVDHAYAEDGNYTVTLTVTDEDGASSSVSATVTVEAPAGLPLALLAAIGLGIAALTATLLYALYRRRKRGRSAANPGNKPNPVVTRYVPAKTFEPI